MKTVRYSLAGASIGLALTPAAAGETTTYSYDALGRLVATTSSGTVNNGVATAIGYDPAGNRSNYAVSGAGGGGPSVPNGSFEAPEVNNGYVSNPTVPGLTFAQAGVAGNGSAWGFAAAPDGDQVAFIQSLPSQTGSIAMSIGGLVPGTAYTARFRLAQRPGHPPNIVTVAFNGASIGTFTPGSTAFAELTAAFTANAAAGTLSFTGTPSSTDVSAGLDEVTIVSGPGG